MIPSQYLYVTPAPAIKIFSLTLEKPPLNVNGHFLVSMDPFSIFVGTLTILGTANSIRQRLLRYRGKSKRLNRLLNEINHIEDVFQRISEASPDAGHSRLELESLLSEANQILLKLHQLIEYRLTKAGGSNQVDTLQWVLHVKELDEYLDRLNVIRSNLSYLMGAITL